MGPPILFDRPFLFFVHSAVVLIIAVLSKMVEALKRESFGFLGVLPGFTGFYGFKWICLGFKRLYRVSLD